MLWTPRKSWKKLKKGIETCDNGNMTTSNPWNSVKAVLRGKYKPTSRN